jgi:hypothetical protein
LFRHGRRYTPVAAAASWYRYHYYHAVRSQTRCPRAGLRPGDGGFVSHGVHRTSSHRRVQFSWCVRPCRSGTSGGMRASLRLLRCVANNCTPTQSDFNAIEFRLGGSSGGSVPQGAAERGRRKRLGKLPHWKWKPRLGPAASLGFGDRCVRKQFKPAAGRACIRGCLQYRRTARTARRSPAPERGRGRA